VKTRSILKPGRPGTKSLAKKYGNALLCVRFRYDEKLRQRLIGVIALNLDDLVPPDQI
jgi:hypothetical protein